MPPNNWFKSLASLVRDRVPRPLNQTLDAQGNKVQNQMKQAIALASAFALPVSTYAADATSKSTFENLIVATAPVIMLFFLIWLAMRLASRKTNAVNERIVESNERIAKSLEELVSILRKKEQE